LIGTNRESSVRIIKECLKIITTKMEGTRKRERPRKRWIDEVEEDLKIMGIRNWHAVARDHREWRRILLEAKVHNGL
jgi:hypothetical protein